MKTLFLLLVLTLAGCATDPQATQALIAANQAQSARPTLALKCPAGGCEFEYTDPRDRQALRLPTNGWDALTSVGNNVANLVPIIVTGRIATAGFDALKGSGGNQSSAVTTTTTGAVSNVGATSTATTMSGTGVLGSGSYGTQANPVTSTSTANPVTTTTTNPVTVP